MSNMSRLYYWSRVHYKKFEWLQRLLRKIENAKTSKGKDRLLNLYEVSK